MAQSPFASHANLLLSSLGAADRALLQPHLQAVDLPVRYILEEDGHAISYVYFLDHGVASVVVCAINKSKIEAGIIGREGMSGTALVLGVDRSPHAIYMQIPGNGQRIESAHLRAALSASLSLQHACLGAAHAFAVQVAHTALANARASVEQRLARWLLMANDRVGGSKLPLTHEFLSIRLGVRRPSVTIAEQVLQVKGVIRATRGSIEITDRPALERLAGGFYGAPEAEYDRITAGAAPLAA